MESFWRNKRVFLTGHTGFKGGWLSLWLHRLGAIVHGYALEPPTTPNLFTAARIEQLVKHQMGDVRDYAALHSAIAAFRPDIVLHLAAQPLLRLSYDVPVETYATNVMGTVHVLEAVRQSKTARVTLIITSDKCYENREQQEGYREDDKMGGHDPYSSSKGCAELVACAYGRSYFHDGRQVVATVRAGNVIGGGDWSRDRLMTDIITAVMDNQSPIIRSPHAVRPWQHVLEPLSGYLSAAQYLWETMPDHPEAWNFGPDKDGEVEVAKVAAKVCKLWGSAQGITITPDAKKLHEATLLKLDSTKAKTQLHWQPRWKLDTALAMTVEWFKAMQRKADMRQVTLSQIEPYQRLLVDSSHSMGNRA